MQVTPHSGCTTSSKCEKGPNQILILDHQEQGKSTISSPQEDESIIELWWAVVENGINVHVWSIVVVVMAVLTLGVEDMTLNGWH
jgi:hypothetical protein